jgi:CubicO group peptidase (beta-lactamase class C family)
MIVEEICPAGEWEVAPDGAGGSAAGREALRGYLERKGTRAAVVARGGRIAAEWYWEGTDAATQLPCYSTTKSVASTAVGLLVDDGLVELEESAARYIPEWREDDRRGVTVRHLLAMTSGIRKDDEGLRAAADRIAFGIGQPLVAAPGTVFDYDNCACAAISVIVRAASGREMADFLQERLYGPLGMTGLRHEMSAGRTLPYSGLQITARDAARFGLLFLRRGRWAGRQIVSEAWIDQACGAGSAVNPDYGLLWWVNARGAWKDLPRDAYSAQGMYGNNVTVLPGHDLVVVRLVGDAAENARNQEVSVNDTAALALRAWDRGAAQ